MKVRLSPRSAIPFTLILVSFFMLNGSQRTAAQSQSVILTEPTALVAPNYVPSQLINVVSDATWKYSYSLVSDWETVNFDDSAWPNVVVPSAGPCDPSYGWYIPNGTAQTAQPIWGQNPVQFQTIYVRKIFSLGSVVSATIQSVVDDDYDLYVNGSLVRSNHDGSVSGILQDNVSSLLQPGLNVIAIKGIDVVGGCEWITADLGIETGPAMPDFKQDNGPWSTTPIAEKNSSCQSMSKIGCAVTSIADVLAYYGINADPGTVNQWLGNNGGFSDCGVNDWNRLSALTNSTVSVVFPSFPKDNSSQRLTLINKALAVNEPVIVTVYPSPATYDPNHLDNPNNKMHFVVITGKAGTPGNPDYIINDPLVNGFFGPSNQSGKTLSETYGPVSDLLSRNYLQTVVIHRPNGGVTPSLGLTTRSPVQALITDPNGNQTGYNSSTGTYLQNIPGSTYGIAGNINDTNIGSSTPPTVYFHVENPAMGTYNVQMIGIGSGTYTLVFVGTNQSGGVTSSSQTGQISQGQIQTTQVTYSSTNGLVYALFLALITK